MSENERKFYDKTAGSFITNICKEAKLYVQNANENKENEVTHIQLNFLDAPNCKSAQTSKNAKGLAKEFIDFSKQHSIMDPEQFWNANETRYPCLYYCYKRIFCIPATSVPSEQLFSLAG